MPDPPARVLVVDDNRVNRLKLSRGVEQLGYAAAAAADGREALERLTNESFDAVLLDILMPELDGFAVLRRMKDDAELRDIPVVVISAVDDMDSVVRCIEMGAEDYLPKNYDPVLLRARLRAGLERKRFRDLERAYLQQEMMLRESEKLATLGRLTAGLAHELNNPAAAVSRSAALLGDAVARAAETRAALEEGGLGEQQRAWVMEAFERARGRASGPDRPDDPLARSDRETELSAWLAERGVADPWRYAGALADIEVSEADLAAMEEHFVAGQLEAAVSWADAVTHLFELLAQVADGTGRVAGLVAALKSYSFLDQGADAQNVDVHRGLDDTLVMLRGRLGGAVRVRKDYDNDVPTVFAHGGELNQVWTNLIENAVDAMDGHGELAIRTRLDDHRVVVEVEDSGRGIAQDDQGRIYEPFFTTKPVGEGTGLGLSIAHSIVTQRHGGTMSFDSHPGRTVFTVSIPVRPPGAVADADDEG